MKKKALSIIFAMSLVVAMVGTASASMIIDSTTGWTGTFYWNDGLGQIDSITGAPAGTTDWSITVGSDSLMSLATAYDGGVAGDEFALYVDGTYTAWTSEYLSGGGYYHGEYSDLFLSAGTHTLTFYLTALAPGYTTGGAFADFSSVTRAAVPEPTTMLLLGSGIVGLGFVRRKFSK